MKESQTKGVATHLDPESWGTSREAITDQELRPLHVDGHILEERRREAAVLSAVATVTARIEAGRRWAARSSPRLRNITRLRVG